MATNVLDLSQLVVDYQGQLVAIEGALAQTQEAMADLAALHGSSECRLDDDLAEVQLVAGQLLLASRTNIVFIRLGVRWAEEHAAKATSARSLHNAQVAAHSLDETRRLIRETAQSLQLVQDMVVTMGQCITTMGELRTVMRRRLPAERSACLAGDAA